MENMPKFNTQDPEAVEIRRKVAAIGSVLNDVTTIEAVRAFEAEAGVKLPEDYVWFITNVGNGGIWKKWGGFEYKFNPLNTSGFAYYAEGYGFPNGKEEKYALRVLEEGDAYYFGIILTGEHYGEISDVAEGIDAYYCGDKTVHNFKELYTAWLDDAYRGYDDIGFDRRHRGSAEELFDKYLDSKDIGYLKSIFLKINKKSASKEFIQRVHTEFLSESDNAKQVSLCDILMKSGFDDPLSLIKRIFRPENYEKIIWYLGDNYLSYFKDWVRSDEVMDGAEVYYPMLVEILKYFNTLDEFDTYLFDQCFSMTVAKPLFDEKDIMDVLTSDNKLVSERISYFDFHCNKTVVNRVRKYIDRAMKKSDKLWLFHKLRKKIYCVRKNIDLAMKKRDNP